MGSSQLSQALDPSPIQKAELFSSLLERELEVVISHSGIIQLRKGRCLFSAGEKAERFYMLLEGSLRVFKILPDGSHDEMARFTSGDTIGDFDFARRAVYDAYAEAVEDSVLVMFPGYGMTMAEFTREEPQTVSRILLGSIVMLTTRIKSTQKIIVENMSWVQELQRRAYEDPGTGLWKQSFLTDELNRLLEVPTTLIMLKPDRFKILVDSRGHGAGDEAMVRIALVLKNITRRIGRGWALRFKSNEVGLLINKSGAVLAETIATELFKAIAALEPVPAQGDIPAFKFSGVISYAVWPEDEPLWDSLFEGNYTLLLDTWRAGGNKVVHYHRPEQK
ncbi:MAG: cyclic nucleotide-binding domain-containing protein [Spirochaetaceae bacterium]|jgi:GGDEF domain-containing protein|nr:cyclic nucleotide-binding domain-containing protein [Spirochaetaceae bacterium]